MDLTKFWVIVVFVVCYEESSIANNVNVLNMNHPGRSRPKKSVNTEIYLALPPDNVKTSKQESPPSLIRLDPNTPNKFKGKFPTPIERFIVRIQNYFSVYNSPEYLNDLRPGINNPENDGYQETPSDNTQIQLPCNGTSTIVIIPVPLENENLSNDQNAYPDKLDVYNVPTTTKPTPCTDETTTTKPKCPEVTTPKPKCPETTTPKPKCPELTTTTPKCPDVTTTQKPKCPEVTTPKPKCPEVTTPKPKCPEVTTQKPDCLEVTTPKPECPEVTTTTPKCPDVTTPKPKCPEVITTTPKCPDVTTPRPKCPEVTTTTPKCPDVTTPKPKCPEVTTPKPKCPEVTTPKIGCVEVTTSKPECPEATTQKSDCLEVTTLKPSYPIKQNTVLNDPKPISGYGPSEVPPINLVAQPILSPTLVYFYKNPSTFAPYSPSYYVPSTAAPYEEHTRKPKSPIMRLKQLLFPRLYNVFHPED